jgi:hypothetical protein
MISRASAFPLVHPDRLTTSWTRLVTSIDFHPTPQSIWLSATLAVVRGRPSTSARVTKSGASSVAWP